MKAYLFPGQASQFVGMGKDLYEAHDEARELMDYANEIIGFNLTEVMFVGTEEELQQTKVTQPSVFLYSVVKAILSGDDFKPDVAAGHSLGEFSALAACGALLFEDGLRLVYQRSLAMQKACEIQASTMAAILGLDDHKVEEVCAEIDEVVVPANYNSPGQLVISGSLNGIDIACEQLIEKGARRAIKLKVGGGFHSPLMEPAKLELQEAIEKTQFNSPFCPIFQNVDAQPYLDPELIKLNLIDQLTAPVLWTQIVRNMVHTGVTECIEVGGKVLSGMVKKVDRNLLTNQL